MFKNTVPNVKSPEQLSSNGFGVPDFHSSYADSTGTDEKRPWAILEAQHFYYKTVELINDSFSFGRMNNEHLMNIDYMPKSCVFDNISRKHFTIKKNGDQINITDHSHWGTFIQKSNLEKIGKGKSVILENDDIISIYQKDHKCFKFKLLSFQDSEMKNEDSISASQRCQKGTPRKLSPSDVNISNLTDGKRRRRPKQNDPDFVYQ